LERGRWKNKGDKAPFIEKKTDGSTAQMYLQLAPIGFFPGHHPPTIGRARSLTAFAGIGKRLGEMQDR